MSRCSWSLAVITGLRFARSRRRSGFVSFITASSIIGIAIGVMALIIGLSAMNGFERELKNRILSVIPEVTVNGGAGILPNYKSYASELKKSDHIKGTAPFVSVNALLERKSSFKAVLIKGVDPTAETEISSVDKFISGNGLSDLTPGANHIILGASIARANGIEVGDKITFAINAQSIGDSIGKMTHHSFVVSGFLSTSGQLDSALAYINLEDAREIANLPDGCVTGIGVKTDDFLNAQAIVYDQAKKIGRGYVYLTDWKQINGHLYDDIQLIRLVIYIALFIVICVASFNIVSGLMMALNDKRASVAILMSMGATSSFIRRIFTVMGMINGLVGIAAGLILGYLISANLSEIFSFFENILGLKLLNKDLYFIDFIPSELHLLDFIIVPLGALVISYLSTLYPAYKAAKVHPAIELTHGK